MTVRAGGAGLTGTSAALHLVGEGANVAVPEGHTVGCGASSRNGGEPFTPAWRDSVVLDVIPSGFLADRWRPATGGRTFPVWNPATEEVIARVADCSAEDAITALDAAASAADDWAFTSPRERATVLHRLAEMMLDDREPLARLLCLEVGKTMADGRREVDYAADYVRWYAEEAVRSHGSTVAPNGQSHILTVAEPVGPCLLITPWNVPLAMAARKVAPALAAGCTAVLKPAELTPLSSLLFAEMARDAGVPPGVLTVVTSSDPSRVTKPLLSDPRLRKLSFTGSTPVGRLLLEKSRPAGAADVDGAGRQRPLPGLRRRGSGPGGAGGDDREDAPGWAVVRGCQPVPGPGRDRRPVRRRSWPNGWPRSGWGRRCRRTSTSARSQIAGPRRRCGAWSRTP